MRNFKAFGISSSIIYSSRVSEHGRYMPAILPTVGAVRFIGVSTSILYSSRIHESGRYLEAIIEVGEAGNPFGLSTSILHTSRLSERGTYLPTLPAPIEILDVADYFQIIFLNQSNQRIEQFHSRQESVQRFRLNYHRIGGLVGADVELTIGTDYHYSGDMMVEFWIRGQILGRVTPSLIDVKNGIMTIEGASVFGRLSEFTLEEDGINESTLKNAILQVINLIRDQIMDRGEAPFFTINPSKIIVDDDNLAPRIEWRNEDGLKILEGLSLLVGKASYGIDNLNEFYFHDQTMTEPVRLFEDVDAIEIDLTDNYDVIANRINLQSKRQDENRIVPISTYDDESSQAIYGIRSIDAVIPFFYPQGDPTIFAPKMVTPAPLPTGSFRYLTADYKISRGQYHITRNLKSQGRIVANAFKMDSDFYVSDAVQYRRKYADQITSRYVFEFIAPYTAGDISISRESLGCIEFADKLLILASSDRPTDITIRYSEYGMPMSIVRRINPRMMYIEIPTSTIDDLLIVGIPVGVKIFIDSIYAMISGVKTDIAYYESHEIEVSGGNMTVRVDLGENLNDLVNQISDLKDNAKLANDLLTKN